MKTKIKTLLLRLLGAPASSVADDITAVMLRVQAAQGPERAAQCARDCLLQRAHLGDEEFAKTVAVWSELCDDLAAGVDCFNSTTRHGAWVPAIPL